MSKTIFFPAFASLVLFSSATGTSKNNVKGCWNLASGYLSNHGNRVDILGAHPGGMLIFTEDLHFMVIINNPDIPKFASGNRLSGTPEEYKAAVINSLGVYGTYTVDENGDFLEQHVLGSTFPNMNGTSRGKNELAEKIDGDKMMESLKIADEVAVNLVWERAK